MSEFFDGFSLTVDEGYFERPYDGIGEESNDAKQIRKNVELKRMAYHSRFGEYYQEEPGYFLPIEMCKKELEWAKTLLIAEKKEFEAKFLYFQDEENKIHGFEIDVDERRFAIPRDYFCQFKDGYACEEINDSVVSILNEDKWPGWLQNRLNNIKTKQSADDFSFELTPETIIALKDISKESLIDEYRDLAMFLGLGDKIKIHKNNVAKTNGIENALEKFGVNDIEELKTILKMTGLKLIKTSNRLPDNDDESKLNTLTEIDALLEAIHKSDNDKLSKPRKGWLRDTL